MEINTDELVQAFLSESEENFETIEQTLLALEADPGNSSLLDELFRAAHTFKGNAACVGFHGVTSLAHSIEEQLDQLRKGRAPLTQAFVTAMLDCVDALRSRVAAAAAGSDEIRPDEEALVQILTAAIERSQATPAAASAEPRAAEAANGFRGKTLRVAVDKLDRMLDLTGEIAISRGRLRQMIEHGATASDLLEAHFETDRLHMDMQELVMKARMVAVGPTFRQHVRTVRDVAFDLGKEVRLITHGEDVELDMKLIEHLRDPLTHMVRNAVSHGIETRQQRLAAGKDPVGTVTLAARHEGGTIVVEVSDDGAGVNRSAIVARAIEQGIVIPGARLSDAETLELLFAPGLSTAVEVSSVSGRGVGMDVVRKNIETLHGSIDIDSTEGVGTTISVRLPLTLAIIDGFIVTAGGETYIIPLDSVIECLHHVDERREATFGVINVRNAPLPFVRLGRYFDLNGKQLRNENVVVIGAGERRAGLVVDELLGGQQIVIKPLGKIFQRIGGLAGSAVMGNGRVAIVLDVPALLSMCVARAEQEAVAAEGSITTSN